MPIVPETMKFVTLPTSNAREWNAQLMATVMLGTSAKPLPQDVVLPSVQLMVIALWQGRSAIKLSGSAGPLPA